MIRVTQGGLYGREREVVSGVSWALMCFLRFIISSISCLLIWYCRYGENICIMSNASIYITIIYYSFSKQSHYIMTITMFYRIHLTLHKALVSGLIIDTFSLMREEEENIRKETKGTCFICSLERDRFDRVRVGEGRYSHRLLRRGGARLEGKKGSVDVQAMENEANNNSYTKEFYNEGGDVDYDETSGRHGDKSAETGSHSSSSSLPSQSSPFLYHIRNDHNMWAYFFFKVCDMRTYRIICTLTLSFYSITSISLALFTTYTLII